MYDTQKPSLDELQHYGVKGMKWGVRNAPAKVRQSVKRKSTRIGDAFFEATAGTTSVHNRIVSNAGKKLQEQDLPKINSKPEYTKAKKLRNRLLNPRDPATKAYRQEVRDAYIKRLDEAAQSMQNSSKTRRYTIRDADGDLPKSDVFWEVRTTRLAHADDVMLVRAILDSDGFITDVVPFDNTLAQGEMFVDNILEHSGMKKLK